MTPERKTTTTWTECIRTHMDVLVATDFFTAEVWTLGGLVTYYVLFFLHLGSRKIHGAGITPHPTEAWMVQVARNVPMEAWGCLAPGPYRIPDRDTPCCAALQHLSEDAGVECVVLPPRSPNFNASAERWVRAVKEACRARVRLCGEDALRHVLNEDVDHAHQKRHHQGKGNVLLLPRASPAGEHDGTRQCRERLGGLLQYDVSTLFRTQNPIGFQSLLIGQWREIAIRGMAALTVIEHFDVFKHSCLGVFVRVKPLQINQLGL